jgi:hypothetical protein
MNLPKALTRRRYSCLSCQGDGKCSECIGSGVNTHFNEDEPKCRSCGGTGMCPECGGSGSRYQSPAAIQDLGLDQE